MIRAGNEELRHRRLFGSTNDRPRKITTRSRDFLIAIPYLHVKKASHKISCQSDLNRASYEQLCRLSKINICSCHFAFCAICIYRGYHGDCTPPVPDTGMWRPSPVRLDRARVTKANHAQRSWVQGHDPHALTCFPARRPQYKPKLACFLDHWLVFLDHWLVFLDHRLVYLDHGLVSSILGLFSSIIGLFPRSWACFTRSSACLLDHWLVLLDHRLVFLDHRLVYLDHGLVYLDHWLVSSILGLFSSIIHLDSAQPWLVFENYAASAKSVSVPVTLLFVQYVYIGGCRELIGGASRS